MRGSVQKKMLKGGPRYYIVYDHPGVSGNGHKKRKQTWESVPPPNTKKNAERFLNERVRQLHRGEFIETKSIAFGDFKDLWVKTYARGEVRPSTLSMYDGLFRNHLLPALEHHKLEQITVEDVQALKAEKLVAGLSPQTVKHILRLLRQMLEHAVDWNYLRSNPCKKVAFPRIPRQEMAFLTPDEVQTFLAQVPGRWQALFITAITTGMRIGELLAMKWQHVDQRRKQYFIREILTRRRAGVAGGFTDPKTDGSAASVDLSPTCLTALRDHHKRQSEEKLAAGDKYEDLDLVFATAKGHPLDHKNVVHRQFHTSLEAAGLRRIRFHDLRHTYAALLIDLGESVKYIQRQLRHTTIQTTMDRYGHLLPEHGQKAMSRLDDRLFGKGLPVATNAS
jgi:integrase